MNKTSIFFIFLFCLSACSDKESNLTITGKVDGLKKGTLYLQKIEDTSLITIDSVLVDGDPNFTFETAIESPQVLYLFLKKVDNSNFDDRFRFFAEPGEMTVNTSLKNFKADAVITGSENHEKLVEFEKMMDRFNSQRLDLIREDLLARKEGNQEKVDSVTTSYENMIKRRYLYTVNFAINNKDLELAPYLAISEVYDANIKYLDTIYKALAPDVKNSKYGKSLDDLLQQRREIAKDTVK